MHTLSIQDQLHAEVDLELKPNLSDSEAVQLAKKIVESTNATRVWVLTGDLKLLYEATNVNNAT
jgi:hypothetical protein